MLSGRLRCMEGEGIWERGGCVLGRLSSEEGRLFLYGNVAVRCFCLVRWQVIVLYPLTKQENILKMSTFDKFLFYFSFLREEYGY